MPMAKTVAAIVLAAGRSTRMGESNKLLALVEGKAMVRVVAENALAAPTASVVVVTGHDADLVQHALEGLAVTFIHNPDFAGGMSTSLRAGVAALPEDVEGALICLGDMPQVSPEHLKALMDAFDPRNGRDACLPTRNGKRGNPVLWGRRYFAEIEQLEGDKGARELIGKHQDAMTMVEIGDDGILVDIDTPEALAQATSSKAWDSRP